MNRLQQDAEAIKLKTRRFSQCLHTQTEMCLNYIDCRILQLNFLLHPVQGGVEKHHNAHLYEKIVMRIGTIGRQNTSSVTDNMQDTDELRRKIR